MIALFATLLFFGFPSTALGQPAFQPDVKTVQTDTLALFDTLRHRPIPVVLYTAVLASGQRNVKKTGPNVAIISHGYGSKNTDYSFIARHLVLHGYVVAGVQHELPTDEPLPTAGNPYEARMPNWQRGVANIRYVLRALRQRKPELDFSRLLLIGHSNGGDQSALFARNYPDQVHTLITLDNRRMPLPRTRHPRIVSIRSSDQPADAGVLPTPAEQARFGIRIIRLANVRHDDMWDGATEAQKQAINAIISDFLRK